MIDVNYITHHRNVYFKMSEDTRLTPYHLSVYNALFMLWNECGYALELSINRNDVMMLSKIGNANTYTKCLKELNDFGYIVYKPSFNPLIGSKVTIIRCDKGSDKATDKGSVKGGSKASDKCSDKGGDTLYKHLNLETNKHINNETNILQKEKSFKLWILEDLQNDIKKYQNETSLDRNDLLAFYDYWRELTPSGKMKFQIEKTWQTDLRLKKWERGKNNFSKDVKKDNVKDMKSAALQAILNNQ
jgi:hypothetical protein